jgi:hypothetical protein
VRKPRLSLLGLKHAPFAPPPILCCTLLPRFWDLEQVLAIGKLIAHHIQ